MGLFCFANQKCCGLALNLFQNSAKSINSSTDLTSQASPNLELRSGPSPLASRSHVRT